MKISPLPTEDYRMLRLTKTRQGSDSSINQCRRLLLSVDYYINQASGIMHTNRETMESLT